MTLPSITEYFREKENIFSNLETRAIELKEKLSSIKTIKNKLETENIIFKEAFSSSFAYLEDIAFRTLLNNTRLAMLMTEEYNYAPYIAQMETALRENIGNILTLIPHEEENGAEILVDLSTLGTSEDWANAVQQARHVLKIGRSEDMEARTLYWIQKIYGPGRQGIKVFTYDKKGNKKDITDQFTDKYAKTIIIRLSFLESWQAPFWELIEFGNASGIMPDSGGEPYPVVAPQRFVEKTQEQLAREFANAYNRFVTIAANKYSDLLLKSFRSKSNKAKVTVDDLNKALDIIAEAGQDDLMTDEPFEKVDTQSISKFTLDTVERFDTFTRRGRRVTVARAHGKFVSFRRK